MANESGDWATMTDRGFVFALGTTSNATARQDTYTSQQPCRERVAQDSSQVPPKSGAFVCPEIGSQWIYNNKRTYSK